MQNEEQYEHKVEQQDTASQLNNLINDILANDTVLPESIFDADNIKYKIKLHLIL